VKKTELAVKKSLSPEEFERFLDSLTKGLIMCCGLRDSNFILREALIRIQDNLNCKSASDCVQDLVDRVLNRVFNVLNRGLEDF
jgi:hypothetical protein